MGMEDSFSCPPPVPTLLPFPVARHRSHPPDLTSISMSEIRDRNAKLYIDEGENVTNFEELQAFAFPLERKMKKVMDFSVGKERGVLRRSTLEDEIDSENQSLLMRMSEDEISTARVEIMDKLNPRLVHFLQKRGNEKLRKQNSLDFDELSVSDHKTLSLSPNNQMKGSDGLNQQKEGVDAQRLLKTISQDVATNFSDGFPVGGRKSNDFWSLWSERVEAVRAIRFSLDGTISENDELLSSNGKNTFCSVYNSDKIMERDYLRTEGDPGFVGYTIKEAVSLTRSVIPGQRTLALNLLAAVLDKARQSIIEIPVGQSIRDKEVFQISKVVDWEAVWAYALGPEPELALSLRLSLDDNHSSVVLACVKVICSALNTHITEYYFDVSEKVPFYDRDICTAPVFRSKPEVDTGFLRGGFWKHSAKSSNIFPLDMNAADDKKNKKRTINDDIIVSGQDFSAGLFRMGIVPRVCFLLEENNSTILGERLLCVLISLARHSSACAHAIVQYPHLIKTILKRFTMNTQEETSPYMTKSVNLLKVLARYDKIICMNMINNGVFVDVTRSLFYPSTSHIKLVQSRDCKFSPLMIEQLRLWKVVVSFGAGIPYFEDFLSTMYPWFLPITFEELFTNKVQPEFFFISAEVYLVLAAMAKGLPACYYGSAIENDHSWSWGRAWEMVDFALSWVSLSNSFGNDVKLIHHHHHRNMVPMLWVISSVNCFLSCVLERVIMSNSKENSPHILEYVLKICLGIAKSYFSYSERTRSYQNDSFFTDLYCLCRYDQSGSELSLASVGCLFGISRVIFFADKILEEGKLPFPLKEFQPLLDYLMEKVSSKWKVVQSIESFGRGGPSPGIGFGWGAAGGGFWSDFVLLAQAEATLLIKLLLMMVSFMWEDEKFISKMINLVLSASLILGPRDGDNFGEMLDLLFQVSTMSHISVCIRKFLNSNGRRKSFHWRYSDDDYRTMGQALAHHFKNRWLMEKKDLHRPGRGNDSKLDTIMEEEDGFFKSSSQCNMFVVGWVHGRFPLPINWFFSPLTTAENYPIIYSAGGPDFWKVVEGGLFFILGVEIISLSSSNPSSQLPLTWKLHSLSAILLAGMTVLEGERSRDVYETLQDFYGQQLSGLADKGEVGEVLRFQKDVDERYPVFVESVVEQFGAVSYGNILFGRQVAVYLCRCVEPTVRLSTWNALLDTHALGLLPSLDNCLGNAECYLEPVEDNDAILEVYVRSWVSGELDKAYVKGSVAYFIVLHHVSCFVFEFAHLHNKTALRNRMLKSLLRDCFRKEQKKGMMIELMKYYCTRQVEGEEEEICGKRMHILSEACEANPTLLTQLQQLHFFSSNPQHNM